MHRIMGGESRSTPCGVHGSRARVLIDRITIKPDVCGGKPTIRGMQITVSHVLKMLAGGMTPEQVLLDFPYLEKSRR
jgi:uncharacterized protein (DUF433 family)